MLVSVQQAPFTQNPSFLFPIQRLEEGSDGGNREERQSERAAVRGQVRSSSWTRIKEEGDRLLLCAPPRASHSATTQPRLSGDASSPAQQQERRAG